jgi:hypothetical protein
LSSTGLVVVQPNVLTFDQRNYFTPQFVGLTAAVSALLPDVLYGNLSIVSQAASGNVSAFFTSRSVSVSVYRSDVLLAVSPSAAQPSNAIPALLEGRSIDFAVTLSSTPAVPVVVTCLLPVALKQLRLANGLSAAVGSTVVASTVGTRLLRFTLLADRMVTGNVSVSVVCSSVPTAAGQTQGQGGAAASYGFLVQSVTVSLLLVIVVCVSSPAHRTLSSSCRFIHWIILLLSFYTHSKTPTHTDMHMHTDVHTDSHTDTHTDTHKDMHTYAPHKRTRTRTHTSSTRTRANPESTLLVNWHPVCASQVDTDVPTLVFVPPTPSRVAESWLGSSVGDASLALYATPGTIDRIVVLVACNDSLVTVTSDDSSLAVLAGDVPVLFTASAVKDNVDYGTRVAFISAKVFSAQGSDAAFAASWPVSMLITVVDDDVAALSITGPAGVVLEVNCD